MKRISSLFLSSLLALILILSGCAGKEQNRETNRESIDISRKISDNILDEMEGPPKMVIRLKDM